ncbi:aa3-type cytochrome c oxidase subunit IV [Sphingomonas sp. S2-65]|nr:aa3-type cytochrome c oxidase subunit IV [Sphingomonas sp. S2-65]UYY57489.1 aa3-type cytochrome c oxidase subunit IV [Sphingomonas sp. S2-65]
MADTGDVTDIEAHAATYSGFTVLMMRGTAVAVLLAALVVFLIAS